MNCAFCNQESLEKISEKEYICINCGFGWNGIEGDIDSHLKDIVRIVKFTKLQNPNLNNDEITELVTEKLHKIENHPVRQDGYCEYCEVKY